jgi:hypothetical protein
LTLPNYGFSLVAQIEKTCLDKALEVFEQAVGKHPGTFDQTSAAQVTLVKRMLEEERFGWWNNTIRGCRQST